MYKKIIYITILSLLIVSCADTMSSVKRGLTGAKNDSSDEFLVRKKDPLILPPDYGDLPTPDETTSSIDDEITILENTLESSLEESIEEDSPSTKSIENSIIKKIQSK